MYSERELIRKLRRQFGSGEAIRGIGDDAAILETIPGFSTLFCSDLLIESTHFRLSTHPPHSIGFKAVAVNVSDIGAMGGLASWCVLSLAVRSDTETEWIDGLFDGVETACNQFGVELVGGDTAGGPMTLVDVAMLGRVEVGQAVTRAGAQPGDGIFVTGNLGASTRGLELLSNGVIDDPAVDRHLYPRPRHEIGRIVRDQATAMIDLSDGLSTDLHHVLEASQVSARIEARLVPRADGVALEQALNGGEDYELLITGTDMPEEVNDLPLTRIGEIVPSDQDNVAWLETESGPVRLEPAGWRHFG